MIEYDQWLEQRSGQGYRDAIGERRYNLQQINAIAYHCIEYFETCFGGDWQAGIDRFDGLDLGAVRLEYPNLLTVVKNLEKDRRQQGYTNQLGPHEKAFILFRAAGLWHFQNSKEKEPTNFLYNVIDPLPNCPEYRVPESWFDGWEPPVIPRRGRVREAVDVGALQDDIKTLDRGRDRLRAQKAELDGDRAFQAKLKRYQGIQKRLEALKKEREVKKRKLRRWNK